MSEKDAATQNESAQSGPKASGDADKPAAPPAGHSEEAKASPSSGQDGAGKETRTGPASKPGARAAADHGETNGQTRSGGRGPALFALLLSILALAGVGWLIYQGVAEADSSSDRSAATVSALQSELDIVRERLTSSDAVQERLQDELTDSAQRNSERLAAIEGLQTELQQRLADSDAEQVNGEQLQARLSSQAEDVQSLEDAIANLGNDLADVTASQRSLESRLDDAVQSMGERQGIQRDVDRDLSLKLDLLEIASLLAIGQARIELVGDKESGLATYRQANRQLAAISDRRLNQAAERMAEEIALIESWAKPDWTRFAALLAQWEGQVGAWPLRPETGVSNAEVAEQDSGESSGWMSTMRQSLGQLVTVERLDELGMDAEMVAAVREQLALHLAAASLAIQRRDLDVLSVRLDHVVALIDGFFEVESEPLRSIRADLVAIGQVETPAAPDGLGQAAAALDRAIEAL